MGALEERTFFEQGWSFCGIVFHAFTVHGSGGWMERKGKQCDALRRKKVCVFCVHLSFFLYIFFLIPSAMLL